MLHNFSSWKPLALIQLGNAPKRRPQKSCESQWQYERLEVKRLLAVGDLGYTEWANDGDAFSIEHVTSLSNAFDESVTSERWSFWWNAPVGWSPGGTAGDKTTGPIREIGNYLPLQEIGDTNAWTVDGNADPVDSPPAQHLSVAATHWHPGLAFDSSSVNQDRFAIASYRVAESGFYRLGDFDLDLLSASNDGVEFYVHVENEFRFSRSVTTNEDSLDLNIGYVAAGDRVFVAVGGNDNFNSDAVSVAFDLERVFPREAPLRVLTGAVKTVSLDGVNASQVVSDEINGLQSGDRVRFESRSGQVTLSPTSESPQTALYQIQGKHQVEIDFGDLEVFLTDTTRGLFRVSNSSQVIIRDAKIDYAASALPFTQGTVRQVGSDFVDFEISAGFVEPVSASNPDESRFNVRDSNGSDVFLVYAYPVSNDGSGRIIEGADIHYAGRRDANDLRLEKRSESPGLYRLYLNSTDPFQIDDGIVVQTRINVGMFSVYHESNQVTISGITAYSAPSTFVVGVFGNNINVLDSHVVRKAGRWKSINADAIHINSAREGAWVENSTFDGVGDDVMNLYTTPSVISSLSIEDDDTVVAVKHANSYSGNFGESAIDYQARVLSDVFAPNYKVGDKVLVYNPAYGTNRSAGFYVTVKDVIKDRPGHPNVVTKLVFEEVFGDDVPASTFDLTGDTDIRDNWMLYNQTLSRNFVIQGNEILNSKRHGIFLMSHRTQVLDNTFSGLAGQAIAGRNETGWPLGLFAHQVLVQGNKFVDNGHGRFYMDDDFMAADVAFHPIRFLDSDHPNVLINQPWYYYRDLEIRDNVFHTWRKGAIAVRNARNFNIVGNTILAPQGFDDLTKDDEVGVNYGSSDPNQNEDNTAIRVSFSTNGIIADNYTADRGINQPVLVDRMRTYYRTPGLVDINYPDTDKIPNVSVGGLTAWFKFDRRLYDSRSTGIDVDHSKGSTNQINFWSGSTRRSVSASDPDIDQYSQPGMFEHAAWFDGVDDGASIGWSRNLNYNVASRRSIAMWINTTQEAFDSDVPRVIYEEGTSLRGFNLYVRDQKIYAGAWDDDWSTFLEIPAAKGWNHVAMVLDASATSDVPQENAFRGYWNGTLMDQGSAQRVLQRPGNIGVGMRSGSTRFDTGVSGPNAVFSGYIDDLRIYNRVLSQDDLAALALKRYHSAWPLSDGGTPGNAGVVSGGLLAPLVSSDSLALTTRSVNSLLNRRTPEVKEGKPSELTGAQDPSGNFGLRNEPTMSEFKRQENKVQAFDEEFADLSWLDGLKLESLDFFGPTGSGLPT